MQLIQWLDIVSLGKETIIDYLFWITQNLYFDNMIEDIPWIYREGLGGYLYTYENYQFLPEFASVIDDLFSCPPDWRSLNTGGESCPIDKKYSESHISDAIFLQPAITKIAKSRGGYFKLCSLVYKFFQRLSRPKIHQILVDCYFEATQSFLKCEESPHCSFSTSLKQTLDQLESDFSCMFAYNKIPAKRRIEGVIRYCSDCFDEEVVPEKILKLGLLDDYQIGDYRVKSEWTYKF